MWDSFYNNRYDMKENQKKIRRMKIAQTAIYVLCLFVLVLLCLIQVRL